MTPFAGFPSGKTRFTPIPDLFFSELLPSIDSHAELILTLHMFWALNRQTGYPRYLTMAELESESSLLAALRQCGEDVLQILHTAAERAIARGTLLALTISDETGQTQYLFINTPQGRKAVQQVRDGDLILEREGRAEEPRPLAERPSIFALYEQNIGLLQPILAEELAEAERDYPPSWIEDAFRIAAERNVRRWRYIKSILERWTREGKDSGESRAPRHHTGYPKRDGRV